MKFLHMAINTWHLHGNIIFPFTFSILIYIFFLFFFYMEMNTSH